MVPDAKMILASSSAPSQGGRPSAPPPSVHTTPAPSFQYAGLPSWLLTPRTPLSYNQPEMHSAPSGTPVPPPSIFRPPLQLWSATGNRHMMPPTRLLPTQYRTYSAPIQLNPPQAPFIVPRPQPSKATDWSCAPTSTAPEQQPAQPCSSNQIEHQTLIHRQESSSSSRFSSSTDSSSSSRGGCVQPSFAWVPLKGGESPAAAAASTEPLYLDPGSQKYVTLSQWIGKYGEQPRESLRKGATATWGHRPIARKDEAASPAHSDNRTEGSYQRWPKADDKGSHDHSPSDAYMSSFGGAFADQVALQNKLLQQRQESLLSTGDTLMMTPDAPIRRPTNLLECGPGDFPSMVGTGLETLSPASPNPEPSGPSDLGSLQDASELNLEGEDQAFSLLGSNASFAAEDLPEESTRAAVEEAQRQRGLAAKLNVINNVLSQKEQDAREQLENSQAAQLREEIARLRAEAELFKKKAEEEERKREEERLENLTKLEKLKAEAERKSIDPHIHEVLRKQEQMQQIIEKMMRANKLVEAGVEYIPHERHGVTAVQFQILRCGLLPGSLMENLQGSVLPYAIVKVGSSSLTTRLQDHMTKSEILGKEDILWNDLFTFPYLNERYLSVTLRIKEDRPGNRQYDHLLGSARIDLEIFIVNPSMCGSQLVQLFDEKGHPTTAIQVSIQTSSEVTHTAFLAMRPKEMTPSDAALAQTVTSAYFESSLNASSILGTGSDAVTSGGVTSSGITPEFTSGQSGESMVLTRHDSQDSLEETLSKVDFRTLEIVTHPWRSLRIVIVGVKGIKLKSTTGEGDLCVRSTLLSSFQSGSTLQTTPQPARVTKLRHKRFFASVIFNEECRFPYSMEKTVLFEFLSTQSNAYGSTSVLGTSQLSLQKLLMTKLRWFKRKVPLLRPAAADSDGVKKVGSMDIILQFLPETCPQCVVMPSVNPIDSSFYSPSELGPSGFLSTCPTSDAAYYDDAEAMDLQLKVAEKAAEALPPSKSCHVVIESGRGLQNPSLRQIEPYVKVKLGNFEAKTGTASSVNPKWRLREGQFAFRLDESWETQLLAFECYHSSMTGRDKLIGITLLPLADLRGNPSRHFNGELTLLNKKCQAVGHLQVTIQLGG
eukprot:Blabericola_migrator_1__2899@NODE_1833_length_3718_cov_168_553821_g1175_i0_p1_GENE_NODE_1833_length_3718_cov_168_553821_g1175_i0NODE_1833_length_3718_cov_168_553821_g1175_i0_p1_ORF_typecomplete_len1130_score201_59C2/PF00168_30/0_0076C2/PF00168_30/0_045C2/PF00168_30/5_3e10SMC_N/PF02463_19/7_2e06HAUS5/PF14817_6/1_9e05DUF737/PF05300_11/0_0028C2C2_1/PF11618_8/2_7e03C2C2_1/PF11618_8/31C2C2_1/PF11618_8/0_93AIP3/PF03915_13/0_045AAA_23/PF13476_6/0_21DUF812/PF05667_11/0_21Atg14/PF10186_9/0_3LCD1/PF09798_